MGDAIDVGKAIEVEATDSIEEEEDRGSELAPEGQSEANKHDLVPEKDQEAQESLKERMKETKRRTEPMAHLCREWRSSHTWDTMRNSRPKMATTTAKVAMLRARTMPQASSGTWA